MLIRAISVLYNETVKAPSEIASQIKDTMSGTLSGLGIIALPAVTGDAIHQIAKLGEPDFGPQGRKTAVAFRSVMDAVSFWANTGAFFAASPALKGVAKIADLNKNISDLGISWNDYNQSLIYENASSGEAREAFAHTRKYNMLRIAKAVISISTAFFAVWMILMGFAIVPTMITAILSLAAAAIAIRRDLYKDEGRFELANLTHLYTIGEHQRVS
ncbi:MAG: hypothetical protein K1X28_08465 [Parachlamydiales bacterium]|nr:hypothetical protein [Parachlamydiales bacterium]